MEQASSLAVLRAELARFASAHLPDCIGVPEADAVGQMIFLVVVTMNIIIAWPMYTICIVIFVGTKVTMTIK